MLQRMFLLLVLGVISLLTKAQNLPLMPYPLSLHALDGQYAFTEQIKIKIAGMSQPRTALLQQQLTELMAGRDVNFLTAKEIENSSTANLTIEVNFGNKTAYQTPKLGIDESYSLRINEKGVYIYAPSDFGALQAIATLKQLIWSATDNQTIKLPYLTINDMPRFRWRGLLIDSVRHFIPIETIKRQLIGMAAAKLNVFHWHLTDDQGWRVESKRYPKLHLLASDGLYYTQQQIKDVVAFANKLGIRVVPEFDLPGHASAIAVAYPELMAINKHYSMEDHWGVFQPLLDPSNEKTYQFIEAIIAEFSEMFSDEYLHIGGDEVDPTQWQQSETIQSYMQQHNLIDSQQLQAHFNQKLQLILAKYGKKMMGWDEIFHPDLAKDIVVQSWRGMESLTEIAQAGYQGLLSTGFYIDQPQPSSFHYRNEPVKRSQPQVRQLQAEDVVEAWQFTMPRIKGSEIKGKLVLIKRNNYAIQGYVKLNDHHYQKVQLDRQLAVRQSEINFTLDSWMGPTRGELNLVGGEPLTGRMLVGNTYYPVSGNLLPVFDYKEVQLLKPLNTEQSANILGGEATLWTELVSDNNLDLRLWPRMFVIAERFWSSRKLIDSASMYQRLFDIDRYADDIGLQHIVQLRQGFKSLVFPKDDITPLMVFAEQIEPASYYTRHHLKYKKGLYHQRARLNQFADFLPVESLPLQQMELQLKSYQRGNLQGLQQIVDTMRKWHDNFPRLVKLVKRNPKLSSIVSVVEDARVINTVGLTIAQSCLAGVKIRKAEVQRVKNTIRELHREVREVSLASGLFVEQLLEVCRK